jgi:hypothetical protein
MSMIKRSPRRKRRGSPICVKWCGWACGVDGGGASAGTNARTGAGARTESVLAAVGRWVVGVVVGVVRVCETGRTIVMDRVIAVTARESV